MLAINMLICNLTVTGYTMFPYNHALMTVQIWRFWSVSTLYLKLKEKAPLTCQNHILP